MCVQTPSSGMTRLHGAISQKVVLFTLAAVRNLIKCFMYAHFCNNNLFYMFLSLFNNILIVFFVYFELLLYRVKITGSLLYRWMWMFPNDELRIICVFKADGEFLWRASLNPWKPWTDNWGSKCSWPTQYEQHRRADGSIATFGLRNKCQLTPWSKFLFFLNLIVAQMVKIFQFSI